jgi:hypothetical protein
LFSAQVFNAIKIAQQYTKMQEEIFAEEGDQRFRERLRSFSWARVVPAAGCNGRFADAVAEDGRLAPALALKVRGVRTAGITS